MSQVESLQQSLRVARAAVRATRRALTVAGARKAAAERELDRATRGADEPAIAAAQAELDAAGAAALAADAAFAQATDEVAALRAQFANLDPTEVIAELPTRYAATLLPVRLETRYIGVGQANPELHVRIYPDDVHVDTHEPELTLDEQSWGRTFWAQTWRAGPDEVRARNVWSHLVGQAGASRAAWIAKSMTPTNPGDRPANAIAEDAPLAVEPAFPPVDTRAEGWTRPALARALPDRWVAIGYRDGAEVGRWWSTPVPDALPVGMDPAATDGPVDTGMQWMLEFPAAMQAGMAIRVPLAANQPLHFDQLLVLGVKASADAVAGAEMLGDLLDSHHYGAGLAVVPQGTPTNNSSDQDSAYAPRETDGATSYAAERKGPLFEPGDDSDGARLTSLLGITRDGAADPVFANVRHADGLEFVDAGHMNNALWPTTWGYFLQVMLKGVVTEAGIARTHRHFVDHVRGRGPLPAIRVGRQPYGILPAVSLSLWQAGAFIGDPFEAELLDYTKKLRDIWRDAVQRVPRIGRTGDIDRDLVETLAMDPQPLDYAVRQVGGPEFAIGTWAYLNVDVPSSWWNTLTDASLEVTQALGWNVLTPLSRAVFDTKHTALVKPLVQERLSETEPLEINFIEMLLKSSVRAIREEEYGRNLTFNCLLYALLRHSLLLGYADAAAKIAKEKQLIAQNTPKEPELVNLDPKQPTTTPWSTMDMTIDMGQYQITIEKALEDPALAVLLDTPALAGLKRSFEHLSGLPSAVLERCMTETLDLSTARLDPWITSLGTVRLQMQRDREPSGTYLGGYGYVEGLRPDAPMQPVAPPQGETAPLFLADAPAGFVHTPSIAQATTAAVLRSAHLAHTGSTGNLLAVDLSSSRVRMAEWILDGVRQGQPLGALLGYRFERALHDARLDPYIAPFRALAPLVANKLEQTDEPVESIAARNVVDGLRLQQMYKDGTLPFGSKGLPAKNSADGTKLLQHLAGLDDAIDALSDAVVAEGVYQAVQGNYVRSGATLDALAAGDVPPPQLEVVRTPRTGVGLTHRVMVLLAPGMTSGAWQAGDSRPRAIAEPTLNAWVGRLLGDPDRWKLPMPLCPLDLVYASEDELAGWLGSADPALARLTAAVRALVTQARALDPGDVSLPTDNVDRAVDGAELAARAGALVDRFQDAIDAGDLDTLGAFGLHAEEQEGGGVGDEERDRVLAEAGERLERIAEAADSPARRIQILLGEEFRVLPTFQIPEPGEFGSAFADPATLLGGDLYAPVEWLPRVARVRGGVARFEEAVGYAELLGADEVLDLAVGQLPAGQGERWVGLPLAGTRPNGGRVSLVVQNLAGVELHGAVCGLLVDEWTEVVPNPTELTGVVLQHDAPGARAPQAILLAVAPDDSPTWSLAALESTVLETIELAKLRAVDTAALGDVGHYLPGLYLAFNALNDTVSTNFIDLALLETTP